MTRQRIGGTLTLAGLAVLADPATQHRPTDPQTLRREAEALLALGLSIPDAAQGLGLTPAALARLLAEHDDRTDFSHDHDQQTNHRGERP